MPRRNSSALGTGSGCIADGLVVVLPAGIGVRGPVRDFTARVVGARCFGPVATLDPSGVVLARPSVHATILTLFAAWRQPLAPNGAAGFRGPVRAWVHGRRWPGPARAIPLAHHAEIVLEVGAYVPPHRTYVFPRVAWAP